MPSSGSAISFAQLQAEFGGAATNISLANYYAGGSNVPAGSIGYPNGGGPTGAGFVSVPSTTSISLKSFLAAAKLTVQTFDIQVGTRTGATTSGSFTVPRIIQGNVTVTVIGGGTSGWGGPSIAHGGGGGGGAQRVIAGSDLFRFVNPGATIPYVAGTGGYQGAAADSTFGTSGQEWYILGGAATQGSTSPSGGTAGTGGTSTGTVPTYGTRTLGTGGNGGGGGGAASIQGGGGGGGHGANPGGAGAGFGGAGAPGNPGTGNIIGNPSFMGVWPGGGGGGTDSSGQTYGAQGAMGAVRIQYTGSST